MNELTKDQFQELLREALDIDKTNEAILTGGIVIAEWLLPNGHRFLTRNGIGPVTEWQIQGYLYSTIDDAGWSSSKEVEDDSD